jgi:hypothetical protein
MRFDFIYFIGAALFAYEGGRQWYFRANVNRLEAEGRLKPDAAERIRRKPAWHYWLAVLATVGFLVAAFVDF